MHVHIGPIAKERGASKQVVMEGDSRPLGEIDSAIEPRGPIRLQAKVTNIGTGFLLQGKVELTVRLTCTRCIESFETLLATDFEERFRRADGDAVTGNAGGNGADAKGRGAQSPDPRAPRTGAGEEEEAADNTFSGDRIELDEFAREVLLLAIPMKRLCSPSCRGICPKCGRNRNRESCACEPDDVDPRLAGLADFLKSDDE